MKTNGWSKRSRRRRSTTTTDDDDDDDDDDDVVVDDDDEITKLKIDSNPFAKGFRDSSRLTDFERETMESMLAEQQSLRFPHRLPFEMEQLQAGAVSNLSLEEKALWAARSQMLLRAAAAVAISEQFDVKSSCKLEHRPMSVVKPFGCIVSIPISRTKSFTEMFVVEFRLLGEEEEEELATKTDKGRLRTDWFRGVSAILPTTE
ncbi:hypothetical protein M0804_001366 [Polistes exclamans]|nr:hypothetical protein M0804_001366 [Polistes exclamans]